MALPGFQPTVHRTGVPIWLTPGQPAFQIELHRAPDNGSGAPNTSLDVTLPWLGPFPVSGGFFLDALPVTGTLYWYRWRHVLTGWDPSVNWTPWVSGTARPISDSELAVYRSGISGYPHRRDLPMVDLGFAAQATESSGSQLPTTVVQTDGAGSRTVVKGVQTGTGKHSGAVTFPVSYQNTPRVLIRGLEGGISYEPRSAQWSGTLSTTLPQYDDCAATNVSASGYTIRARLRQKGTPTNRTAEFSADITSSGGTAGAGLSSAPANNDTYSVAYDLHVTPIPANKGIPIQIVVALDSAPTGSGFTQRSTLTYNFTPTPGSAVGTAWLGESQSCVVPGLTGTAQVRLRVVSISGPIDTFSVHGWRGTGAGDPGDGVTYTTATDIYASKTPDAADSVSFETAVIT